MHVGEKNISLHEILDTKMANGVIVDNSRPDSGRLIPKENLSAYLSEVSIDDIPWAVNFLVSKLVLANREQNTEEETHAWNDYQLSPEIEALSSFERKELPRDYDKACRHHLDSRQERL